jgi:hypothetical protein
VKKRTKKQNKISKSKPINNKHLHLVAGQHQHTHSLSPVTANDIKELEAINPEYGKKLFKLLEDGLELEKQEVLEHYESVKREQENDKLSIEKQVSLRTEALKTAKFVIVFLVSSSFIFAFFGYEKIAGTIITVTLIAIIKAIFTKS